MIEDFLTIFKTLFKLMNVSFYKDISFFDIFLFGTVMLLFSYLIFDLIHKE